MASFPRAQHTKLSLSQPSGPQRLSIASHVSVGLDSMLESTTKNKPDSRQAALYPPNCGATGAMHDAKTEVRLQNTPGEPDSGEDSSLKMDQGIEEEELISEPSTKTTQRSVKAFRLLANASVIWRIMPLKLRSTTQP